MKTSLDHLSNNRRIQLQTIAKTICNTIYPEKIILFGAYASDIKIRDDFTNGRLPTYLSSYEILVVTKRGSTKFDYEVHDILQGPCRFETPTTIIVHDIDYVNGQLLGGHYFFTSISREGIILYDAGITALARAASPDLVHIHATAQKDFERWWHQSNVFYNNALFNYQQKETKIAVFHLHQAAESAYQAILLSFTGYKPCTHNLDKLRSYTNRFSVKLASLFPRDTENEDHIFKLLLRGYVASRYDETYKILETELTLLIERVKQLLTIAERICKNQFIHLEKQFTAE